MKNQLLSIVTIVTLLLSPILIFSQAASGPAAPAFGLSGCFAIFSSNGAVTNTGTSFVTGDIGTNAGASTGYDPLYVTGYNHAAPDQYTGWAQTDLANVFNYLNSLPNDSAITSSAQFSNNLVLSPKTYILNGATTLSDSLYLNAQGNYSAVFVIKIIGSLTTISPAAKVFLINGAQAKNVYWLVDGPVNIGGNSIFNGTVVSSNSISIGTGTTLNGRALTTAGAITTDKIIATSPSGNCNTLPVSWLYFRGKPVQQSVSLEWGTTNEINNGFFTIERSIDGNRFETLTTINASTEIGNKEYYYSFTDQHPYGINFYRISQTDKDGQRHYLRTIQVKLILSQNFTALHYVQNKHIYVQVSGALPGNGSLLLYNTDGKKISSQKIILTKEVSMYKIEKALNNGVYLIYIESQGQKLYHGKVMVL